jgi:hypothetical protein
MERSPEGEAYQEPEEWTYELGLFEYLEQGAGAEHLPEPLLARSSVSRGSPKLQRILDWLRGSRLETVICEREPIWVPIVEAWAASGGTFEFTYRASGDRNASAEVRVFALGGLGGSSSRQVSKSISWPPESEGRALYIQSFVTIRRYVLATGEQVDRVDVDCAGETGEYRHVHLPASTYPFAGATPSEADLKAAGYAVPDVQRCRDVIGPTQFTPGSTAQHSWTFGPDLELPLLQTGLKLQVGLHRAESFTTTFTLPGGRDYAFCTRMGESPVAPICVPLRPDV